MRVCYLLESAPVCNNSIHTIRYGLRYKVTILFPGRKTCLYFIMCRARVLSLLSVQSWPIALLRVIVIVIVNFRTGNVEYLLIVRLYRRKEQ